MKLSLQLLRLPALFMLSLCVLSSNTLAQSSTTLEEVIVTAQKKEESIQDAAIDISVLSDDDILNYGIMDISGVALSTPGITFQNTGVWAQVYLRGVGTRVSQAGLDTGVATYLDDRYVGRQSGIMYSMTDVERIEVLKGPQGVLYGRNSTGGAIRVITKEVSDDFEGKVMMGLGDYGFKQGNATLNMPISNDFGIRASIQTRERDAFKENIVPGGRDYDDLDSIIARVKARWKLSDDTTLKISHMFASSHDLSHQGAVSADVGNNAGVVLGGITTSDRDKIASSGTAMEVTGEPKSYLDTSSVRLETTLGQYDLAAYLSYSENDERKWGDYDATSLDTVDVVNASNQSEELSGGFELTSDNDGPLSWVIGMNYFEMEVQFDYDLRLFANFGNRPNSQGLVTYNLDSYGLFGSVDYELSDKWTLSLGGRYSSEEKDVYLVVSPVPGRATLAGFLLPHSDSEKWSEFNPKATLTYNMENGIIYATYSSGFKSGGFNYPHRPGGTPLDPEEIDMIEIGYKADISDTMRFSSTLFMYDYKGLQITRAANASGAVTTENATDSDIWGVDFDFAWAASDNLVLKFSGEYLDTEYKDFDTGGRVPNTVLTGNPNAVGYGYDLFNAEGLPLLRSPELSWTMAAQYDSGPMSFNLSYAWKDEYYFDFVRVPEADSLRQDAHGVMNARATYAAPNGMSISVWGKNISDEDYLTDSVIGNNNQRINYAHPRTYGVDLTYEF